MTERKIPEFPKKEPMNITLQRISLDNSVIVLLSFLSFVKLSVS